MANPDPLAEWLRDIRIAFPFFIRYVDTAGAGGDSQRKIEDKGKVILEEVLDPDYGQDEISVYRVASADELLRATMAIRLFRGMSDLRVYAIALDDFGTLPPPVPSEANCPIPCYWTRSRHHDLQLNQSQREELALRLAATARTASPKIRKNRLKPFHDRAVADKCYSVLSASTQCSDCDPVGQRILSVRP